MPRISASIANLLILLLVPNAPRAGQLLWQTNSDGNDIHVFDVASRQLVERLEIGPNPHGIAAPADARFLLVTLEANGHPRGELLSIDPRTFEITHRLPMGRQPHALAVTPDGRWAYVPCRDGHYWVVDLTSRVVAGKVRTGGRPHNTRSSSDGRFMYLSSMGDPRQVTIVDVRAGHRPVGTIPFRDSL